MAQFSYAPQKKKPIPLIELILGVGPNEWHFDQYGLHLMNAASKKGCWVRVLHVDRHELHVTSLDRTRLADVFTRV